MQLKIQFFLLHFDYLTTINEDLFKLHLPEFDKGF